MDGNSVYTVIVADDEDELRQALCSMLPWEELGFRLAGSAANGLEALEQVEQLEPDLLITDIQMPFISGIELARQVREIHPATQIVFLSGYDEFEYAQQAIEYNVIRYLLKPVSREKMGKELTEIHQKMDEWFEAFRRPPGVLSEDSTAGTPLEFLLPSLILDDDPDGTCTETELRSEAEAAGLPPLEESTWLAVAVVRLVEKDGTAVTGRTALNALSRVAAKYFFCAGFCSRGRTLLLLKGDAGSFHEHLYILGDEWYQTCFRTVGLHCSAGIGRPVGQLCRLHQAYQEAQEALKRVRPEQGGVRFFTDVTPGSQHRGGEWLCRQAVIIIERHYQEPDLSLTSLSDMLAVSPNHLSACIKKYTGEGFLSLLISKRMDEARKLLEMTSLRISEVAGQCGYTDQHYFSYCFKKCWGTSPNAFRRQLKERAP